MELHLLLTGHHSHQLVLILQNKFSLTPIGNILIGVVNHQRIRLLNFSSQNVVSLAGTGSAGFSGDTGAAVSAQLNSPHSAIKDFNGDVYITDTTNHRIRKVDSSGIITTVIGDGTPSNIDGTGTGARVNAPQQILFNTDHSKMYIVDTANSCIRQVTMPALVVSEFAGDLW